MTRRFRKPFVAAATCAAFLSLQGPIGTARAAEWPTWPRPRPAAPSPESPKPAPAPDTARPGTDAAAKAGEAAGKKTAAGISAGTIGWAALITAGVVGIAVAVGGGGSSSNH